MGLALTTSDDALLEGERGPGMALAMRVVVRLADSMGASELLDISGAHIDSCLFHGQSGLDFVDRLVDGGAQVSVPTTLNVSSLDLLHPELYRGNADDARASRALMDAYVSLGCEATWTCAPYQRDQRPGRGDHIAWAESNAIVFANSVLGARTHRYGDFIDICAAVTGRAPAAGLHLDENRRGQMVFELGDLHPSLLDSDVLAPVLGYVVGAATGAAIPVITGLPSSTPEYRLKALGAAAASSGGIGMFHAVGLTPEAPDLATALHGRPADETVTVTADMLLAAREDLNHGRSDIVGAICLGTPHYSIDEFERLVTLLDGRRLGSGVLGYVNTAREIVLELQLRGWVDVLISAGIQLVTDTCTYITPVMAAFDGVAVTDSAKWAHYAPGNIGVDVRFASVEECVESAVAGTVVRVDDDMWQQP